MASIDNRVVSINFVNESFEQKVAQTLKSLASLKSSLSFSDTSSAGNLDKAAASMSNLGAAAQSVSLSGLAASVDNISAKFSAMGVVAFTTIQNIVNRAVDAGIQMAKSLSITPIATGFDEYELKLGSIQTIMAGSGESLEVVNQKLQELNAYSDKTIYSFKDMTSNIGKFTNAGVSLDMSVASIQGIANVAALSGANAEEASRAMYNFAQALSSGSVKLMDWKSIELANMATVEFKTELLNSAVAAGTLKKVGDGLYETLEGTAVTATKGFNESLTDQWLTTQALTETLGRYSDETTDIGARATAAAQDVKTFSQMMDTLKESAASGWAATSEIVVGNFDEAKALFTEINNVVGGIIGGSADARNKVLQDWKDLGGRTLLIQALKDAIKGVVSIIKPFKDAFRAVFPKKTGEDLYKVTEAVATVTKTIAISGKTASAIRGIFKGIFSILSIGITIIKSVIGLFFSLFSIFSKIVSGPGGSILGFSGQLGELINRLRLFLVDGKGIANFFKDIGESIFNFVSKINFGPTIYAFKTLKETIQSFFGNIDFGAGVSGLGEIKNAIGSFFSGINIEPVLQFLQKIMYALSGFVSNLNPGAISNIFSSIKNGIVGLLTAGPKKLGEDFGILSKAISLYVKASEAVLGYLKSFGSGALDAAGGVSSVADKIKSAIASIWDAITGAFNEQNYEKTLAVLKTGLFGGVLALIYRIFTSGPKKLFDGLNDITKAFTKTIEGLNDTLGAMQTSIKAGALLKIAIALGILTVSIVVLSMLDPVDVASSLGALAAGLALLLGAMKAISKITDDEAIPTRFTSVAFAIGLLAGAILLLSISLALLSLLNTEKMIYGLFAIVAILQGLSNLASSLKGSASDLIFAGIGIGFIAASMLLLAVALTAISFIDAKRTGEGLLFMAVALGVIVVAIEQLPPESDLVNIGFGLNLIAISLYLLAGAITIFGTMNLLTLAIGITAIGLTLYSLGKGLQAFPTKDIFTIGASLILISAAMYVMAVSIEKLGQLSLFDIVKGIFGFSLAMRMLTKVMEGLKKGSLGNALTMFLIVKGLEQLVNVLILLAEIPIMGLIKGVGVLVVLFRVLAIAMLALKPLVPIVQGFALAIFLAGAGFGLFGIGIFAIAKGIELLAKNGKAGLDFFLSVLDQILAVLPKVAAAAGEALFIFVTSFLSDMPALLELISSILDAVSKLLVKYIPILAGLIILLIDEVLLILKTSIPKIVAAGFEILIGFLTGIRDNIKQVITLAGEIISEFILGLASYYTDIVTAAIEFLVEFINGITDSIELILPAVTALITEFIDGISDSAQDIIDSGAGLIADMIIGIGKAAEDIVTAGANAIVSFIEGIASNAQKVIDEGSDAILDFLEGIDEAIRDKRYRFIIAGINIFNALTFDIIPKLTNFGKNMVEGIWSGIEGAGEWIKRKLTEWSSWLPGWVKDILGIDSPSKVFAEIGNDIVLGLNVGMDSMRSSVKASSMGLAKELVNGFKPDEITIMDNLNKTLNAVMTGLESLDEFNPTITPVLDLTGAKRDAKSLGAMLQFNSLSTSMSYNQARGISNAESNRELESVGTGPSSQEVNFNQTINAPTPLSTNDIYRQTRSQIVLAKQELSIL